jgi:hypothetical protein
MSLTALCWFVAYSSTLQTDMTFSSETSGNFYRTTWRYIPESEILRHEF